VTNNLENFLEACTFTVQEQELVSGLLKEFHQTKSADDDEQLTFKHGLRSLIVSLLNQIPLPLSKQAQG